MPYKTRAELPDAVKDNLPPHAQDIFKEAFNSAYDQYKDPDERRGAESREEAAFKVAWAAVKKGGYEKDEQSGHWVKSD
jgi:cation transport regulator